MGTVAPAAQPEVGVQATSPSYSLRCVLCQQFDELILAHGLGGRSTLHGIEGLIVEDGIVPLGKVGLAHVRLHSFFEDSAIVRKGSWRRYFDVPPVQVAPTAPASREAMGRHGSFVL